MPPPTATAPLVQRIWPWLLGFVVLIGTAGSNRNADVPAPVPLAMLLMALAVLPAVLPRPATPHRFAAPARLLVSGLATGAYFAYGFSDGPAYLALPAVTFVVATADAVRAWAPWAAAAVVPVCLGLGGRYLWWQPEEGHQHFWQAVGVVAIVAASGAVATAARSRREARAERVGRTATEERLRMAQELHDGVGHGLSVIAMQAGVALHLLDRDPAKVRASLEAIRATSKESLDALRSELAAMSGEPAPRRPSPGTAELPAVIDRVRGAGLHVEVTGDPGPLPGPVGEAVYAIVQEALTNVLRHAAATRARVRFERVAGDLVVSVSDDGRSAGAAGGSGTGLGIPGMRSRVERLGGTLDAGPAEGGFEVRAELPLATEEVRR